MKREWHIEEELIEWLDTKGAVRQIGREIRLVNSEGEVIGRRVVDDDIDESYMLIQDQLCFHWVFIPAVPEPTVFIAELPQGVRQLWIGRSLMMYRRDTVSVRSYRNRDRWKLVERTAMPCNEQFLRYSATQLRVEQYRYVPDTVWKQEASVEWRVYTHFPPPLLGAEVPVFGELFWDGQLIRRHKLIQYRTVTAQERVFFEVPRRAKRRQIEPRLLFSPLSALSAILIETE